MSKVMFRRFLFSRIWSSAQDYAVMGLLLNPVVFWISTWQNLSGGNDLYWRCTSFWKGISAGPALKYFTWFIGAGGPRLDEFIFFSVSQFLIQVLSRSCAPLFPSLDFSSFFPHPGRGIFPSLPGFTTYVCFLKRCAQCCWVNILSTNPFCGLLHSHRQGISRFPQIGVVFLTFKKIVPLNRKHKIYCTPSLSFKTLASIQHYHTIIFFDILSPLSTPMILL